MQDRHQTRPSRVYRFPLVPGVLEGSCAVVERWRGVVREGGAWSEKEGVWLDYMRSDL